MSNNWKQTVELSFRTIGKAKQFIRFSLRISKLFDRTKPDLKALMVLPIKISMYVKR